MSDTPNTPSGDRIAKVLSRAGVASRREAERMIELGQVTVNGKVITSPALNVTDRDRITVDGHTVGQPEAARLWLYYKPDGLVTSNSDEKGRDTIFDHLPEDLPRVMSIGRLDLNSEGLLLLTNDGGLKRQLELPSTGWLRKYRVRVNGNPTDPDLAPLRKGITVEGERFQPMIVVLDRIQGANAWLTVGLREGKNREIRRAMTAINLTVNRLIRVSYGPFRLGDLTPGEVTEVKGRVLRDQLGQRELPEDAVAPAPRTKGAGAKGPRVARPVKPGAKPAAKRGPNLGTSLDDMPRGKPMRRTGNGNGNGNGTSKPDTAAKPAPKFALRAAAAATERPSAKPALKLGAKPNTKSWAKSAPKPTASRNAAPSGKRAPTGAKPANRRPKGE
ncbi:pseudouridine synthase [Pseudorhodobacter ferrugineus]|uniref:pseudouridine synthase n=1 Tax=Pseudorhodobacter ferrugineus TaxID=77008 RepID=UPI000426A2D9|nr:pseudouridine synthase [Pseudorhodobacter ferrugineus]